MTTKEQSLEGLAKLIIEAPHPERMPGAHLTPEARAQLAFAQIDVWKSKAAALLQALKDTPMTTNDVSDTRISDALESLLAITKFELGPDFAEKQPWASIIAKCETALRHPQPVNEPAEWQVEAAARAFDHHAFKSWQQSYDYEMGQSGNADEAKSFADWSMGKRIEEVRTAARNALRAASIPAPEWHEFTERHRTHFPYPDGTKVEVHGYDTGYSQAFQTVMQVGSPQWKSHARFIAGWRLPAPERSKEEAGVKGLPVSLAECPIGLFYAGSELCLKTEYGDNNGRIDAYIVSSGEFFWGGTSTPQEQRKVLVTPVSAFETPPLHKEGAAEPVGAMDGEIAMLFAGLRRNATPDNTLRLDRLQALYAAPAPVPVTIDAAMIERFQNAYRQAGAKRHWQLSWPDADASFEILVAALSQKPGEQG